MKKIITKILILLSIILTKSFINGYIFAILLGLRQSEKAFFAGVILDVSAMTAIIIFIICVLERKIIDIHEIKKGE